MTQTLKETTEHLFRNTKESIATITNVALRLKKERDQALEELTHTRRAAYFYPDLRKDADKAHAAMHGESCLCTQSLESMASEMSEELAAARAVLAKLEEGR